MRTVSLDCGQLPFEMVHTNVLTPVPSPVTLALKVPGFTMVPEPETSVQIPVDGEGLFPDKTA